VIAVKVKTVLFDSKSTSLITKNLTVTLGIFKYRYAEILESSSRTSLIYIQKQNNAVERSGFCSVCRRVRSKYEIQIAQKENVKDWRQCTNKKRVFSAKTLCVLVLEQSVLIHRAKS